MPFLQLFPNSVDMLGKTETNVWQMFTCWEYLDRQLTVQYSLYFQSITAVE